MNKHFNITLLKDIAEQYSTPIYVYNKQKITENYQLYKNSFEQNNSHNYLICYAVKANSNLHILKLLAHLGAGFDIVSIGELKRVLQAGGNPNKIVFSGVGKQDFEIEQALYAQIYCFNVESESELILINQIAKELNQIAPISIRINPNINAKSHPYISTGLKDHKFGIPIENAEYIYNLALELDNINIIGVDCHIGSQLTDLAPLQETCNAINNLLIRLEKNNINLTHVNLGGGLGIDYEHKTTNTLPTAKDWVQTILNNITTNKKIIIEPGRSIVGNAGLLLSKVIYNKSDQINKHNFTIIDAAMNDLLRPALYSAQHKIINICADDNTEQNYVTSVVGPVCESSDVFIKNENLAANSGDLLAILDTGAYGFAMSSNYNARPRAAEIMIDHDKFTLIRSRETIEDLYRNEIIL
jgi:diaminopimelate decarboxylase